jgi:hypothetical protein
VEKPLFDELVAHVRSEGIDVIGPVALGGRFWSAYFYDPNGIRLELATSQMPANDGIVNSVLQTEDEARQELETLFSDPAIVQSWLDRMPLRVPESA